jgi:hypothetical protein
MSIDTRNPAALARARLQKVLLFDGNDPFVAPASPLTQAPISRRRCRVLGTRRRLLRAFAAEQFGAIEAIAKVAQRNPSDDTAVAYLAKCIAAHSKAVSDTARDLAAIAEEVRSP